MPEKRETKHFKNKFYGKIQKEQFLNYLDRLIADIPAEQTEVLKDMEGEDYDKPYWSIIEHEKRERV